MCITHHQVSRIFPSMASSEKVLLESIWDPKLAFAPVQLSTAFPYSLLCGKDCILRRQTPNVGVVGH